MTPKQRLSRHSEWLLAHPFWSWGIAIWVALAVLVLAESLKYALDKLSR